MISGPARIFLPAFQRLSLLLLLFFVAACDARKDELVQPEPEGTVQFWHNGNPAYSVTTVTIGATLREITQDVRGGEPGCGAAGCALFTLPAGTYTYRAKEEFPGSRTWTGHVQVKNGHCTSILLD